MTTTVYSEIKSLYPEHIVFWVGDQFIDVAGIDALIINAILEYPLTAEHAEWRKSMSAYMRFSSHKLDRCIKELQQRRISYVIYDTETAESFPDNKYIAWKRHIEKNDKSIKIGSIVTYEFENEHELLKSEIFMPIDAPAYSPGLGVIPETDAVADGSKVSCYSVFGRALLGKKMGDTVKYKTTDKKEMVAKIIDVINL